MRLENIKELCEHMSTKQVSLTFRVRSVQIDDKDYHSVVVTTETTPKTDYRAEDMCRLEKLVPCVADNDFMTRAVPEYLRDNMSENDWMEFCDMYDAAVTTSLIKLCLVFLARLWLRSLAVAPSILNDFNFICSHHMFERVKEVCALTSAKQASFTFYVTSVNRLKAELGSL